MMTFAFLYALFLILTIHAGWAHQARKTPEEQHLDFLIDAGDPYATQYSAKLFGPPLAAVEITSGQRFALI